MHYVNEGPHKDRSTLQVCVHLHINSYSHVRIVAVTSMIHFTPSWSLFHLFCLPCSECESLLAAESKLNMVNNEKKKVSGAMFLSYIIMKSRTFNRYVCQRVALRGLLADHLCHWPLEDPIREFA